MNKISLEVATRQLESMIGAKVRCVMPDAIDAAVGTFPWIRIPTDMEDDGTMAELLGLASLPPDTELVVVTDASFGEGRGAFGMFASEFEEFYAWHLGEFAERVFSGCDVVIWAQAEKRLWLVHHEGAYATMKIGAT